MTTRRDCYTAAAVPLWQVFIHFVPTDCSISFSSSILHTSTVCRRTYVCLFYYDVPLLIFLYWHIYNTLPYTAVGIGAFYINTYMHYTIYIRTCTINTYIHTYTYIHALCTHTYILYVYILKLLLNSFCILYVCFCYYVVGLCIIEHKMHV